MLRLQPTRTSTATSCAGCFGAVRSLTSFGFKTSGCQAPTIRQFSNGLPRRIAWSSRTTFLLGQVTRSRG